MELNVGSKVCSGIAQSCFGNWVDACPHRPRAHVQPHGVPVVKYASLPDCVSPSLILPHFGAHIRINLFTQVTLRDRSPLSSFCFTLAVLDFGTESLHFNYGQFEGWDMIVFRARGPGFLDDHLHPKEL